jgi:hypothetical protein
MPSKLINTKVPNVSDKDKRADEVGSDFVKKSYTRPWGCAMISCINLVGESPTAEGEASTTA